MMTIEKRFGCVWPRATAIDLATGDVEFINTGNWLQSMGSKCASFGVPVRDLAVRVSSSLDFPDDETEDTATIALAHQIRDGDWEVFLGPKETQIFN